MRFLEVHGEDESAALGVMRCETEKLAFVEAMILRLLLVVQRSIFQEAHEEILC
jgi:hypothetical protein